jgi:glucose-6-phosphate-specific signal transduction histidine kinase
MTTSIRIQADEAKRLRNDTAFKQFVQSVRELQISIFMNSAAEDIDSREEAHAVLRALDQIEMQLNAAIAAETMLDRKQRN